MTELWLMRHGETTWSSEGRHTSTSDIPLTDRGRERALRLPGMLAGTKFGAVFTSPLQRARETCRIAGYGDVAVADDNLREWNYGEAEGKTTQEMRAIYGPTWSVWTSPLANGETLEQVGARADAVIARSLAAVPGEGAVALFAHAHVLRILTARWIGLPPSAGALLALETGSVSVLAFERETRVISRWNL